MTKPQMHILIISVVGGAATLLGLLTMRQYRRDLDAAYKQLENRSQVVTTQCGAIEYASEGSGLPVLVIHGNGGGFDQGLGLARGYLGQGFQIVAPSRFGYLRSPLPTGATPALQADAYACLLDYLKIDRAAIFTSSAGVTSAVQFALRHPQRLEALVFHSPNAPGPVEMTLPPEGVLKRLFRSNFAFWAMTDYLEPAMHSFVGVPKGFHLTETQRADVATTLRSVLPTSARATGMIFDTYVSNPDINNNYRLESIAAPTLVVSAVDDPMTLHVNARTLVESIPGAQLLAVPNGGHMMLGHTAEVSAAITQFLRTHMDTSGEEVIQ